MVVEHSISPQKQTARANGRLSELILCLKTAMLTISDPKIRRKLHHFIQVLSELQSALGDLEQRLFEPFLLTSLSIVPQWE